MVGGEKGGQLNSILFTFFIIYIHAKKFGHFLTSQNRIQKKIFNLPFERNSMMLNLYQKCRIIFFEAPLIKSKDGLACQRRNLYNKETQIIFQCLVVKSEFFPDQIGIQQARQTLVNYKNGQYSQVENYVVMTRFDFSIH